jgi:phosphoribosylformylglycinamidine synthase
MGMSPKEIWCNEAQERYVLAIKKIDLDLFERICKRERCPFAVVGHATKDQKLIVTDTLTDTEVINMSLDALLGKPPRTKKSISKPDIKKIAVSFRNFSLAEHIERVLKYPAVASKSF